MGARARASRPTQQRRIGTVHGFGPGACWVVHAVLPVYNPSQSGNTCTTGADDLIPMCQELMPPAAMPRVTRDYAATQTVLRIPR